MEDRKKSLEKMTQENELCAQSTKNPLYKYASEILANALKKRANGEIDQEALDNEKDRYYKIMLFSDYIYYENPQIIKKMKRPLNSNTIEIEQKILHDLQTNEELFKLNKKQIKEYVDKYF
jgi:hypothetical protein